MAEQDLPRVHGGIDELGLRALHIDPSAVVDFSVNLNPYGPCLPVLEAARTAPLDRYPDPQARAARAAWAQALAVPPEQVAVGHGAADLFWAVARAVLTPGARAVIAEPTFSEFRVAAAACGARVEQVMAPPPDYRLELQSLARSAQGAAALYLCSPNNPTGELVPLADVVTLASQLPHTLVVLDQSFLSLSDHADEPRIEPLPDNLVRVRSLTKELACPGLRIGLCLASAAWTRRIEAQRPTWATSSPALAALEVSASQHAFVSASWQRMRADRVATMELLRASGLSPLPTSSSYQLVPLREEASLLQQRLLTQGVLVRDCASFGLPRHVRIAALPAPQRARLSAALDAVLSA